MAHVLFLVTDDPSKERYWNKELVTQLSTPTQPVKVSVLSWREPQPEPDHLAKEYSHICLATVAHYDEHVESFLTFLNKVLPAAQLLNPALHIFNSPQLTAWNVNKTYLDELIQAGFHLPQTKFQHVTADLEDFYITLRESQVPQDQPLIIKPSIGVSGKHVSMIKNLQNRTTADDETVETLLRSRADNASFRILVQEFIKEIQSSGEWSLVFIQGKLIGSYLKSPKAGEYRINSKYGGSSGFVGHAHVSDAAANTGRKAWEWLDAKFGHGSCTYVRVDGVMRDDGEFVLMELECIEPWMLCNNEHMGPNVVQALREAVLSYP